MKRYLTPEQIEAELGDNLKRFRVSRNLSQATIASHSGISVRALHNLESGNGSSLSTFIAVMRALGRETWFDTLAPTPLNPLMLTREAVPRQRASQPRAKKQKLIQDQAKPD